MDILSSSRAFALTVIGALAFPGIALAQQSAWARIDVEGEVPPPRSRACIGYDVSRDRIVLVGGQGTASNSEVDVEFETYRDDSWEWDGEQWEEVTPPGGNPAKCLDESMTYDPRLEQLVMFGVQVRDDGTVANATFGWDGAQWREIAPQGQPPQPSHLRLIGHAVAFDEQRGQPVLYGGWRPADNNEEASAIPAEDRCRFGVTAEPPLFPMIWLNDTWMLDEGGWQQPNPSCNSPSAPRHGHHLFFDQTRDAVISIFGSYGFDTTYREMLAWDGKRWEPLFPLDPPQLPQVFDRFATAYDTDRSRLLLYGGRPTDDGGNLLRGEPLRTETWEWNGQQWQEIDTQGTHPGRRESPAMAYDPKAREVILFGGFMPEDEFPDGVRNDTWVLSMAAEETSIESEGCGCSVEHRRIPTRLMCVLIALGAIVSRRFI